MTIMTLMARLPGRDYNNHKHPQAHQPPAQQARPLPRASPTGHTLRSQTTCIFPRRREYERNRNACLSQAQRLWDITYATHPQKDPLRGLPPKSAAPGAEQDTAAPGTCSLPAQRGTPQGPPMLTTTPPHVNLRLTPGPEGVKMLNLTQPPNVAHPTHLLL